MYGVDVVHCVDSGDSAVGILRKGYDGVVDDDAADDDDDYHSHCYLTCATMYHAAAADSC